MAAGEKIKGKDGIIEMTVGGVTEEIACLTSWTLDVGTSITTDSTSCMLSNGDGGTGSEGGWDTSELESKNWSVTAEHFWQKDDLVGMTAELDATDAGSTGTIKLYPNTKVAGSREYSGSVILESVSITSETSTTITASLTLKGTGALAKAVTV